MFEAKILTMDMNGRSYKIEFDRDAVKAVDMSGSLREGAGTIELTAAVLHAGLKKHNEISRKRVMELIDTALDEGYGLDAFSDVLEEFTRCYKALFTPSGSGKKMKKLISFETPETAAKGQ